MKSDGTTKHINHHHVFKLYVPTGEGGKSTANVATTKLSTGLGGDRVVTRQLQENSKVVNEPMVVREDELEDDNETERTMKREIAFLKASNAKSMKEMNLYAENKEGEVESPNVPMNVSVAKVAGVPFSPLASPPVKGPGKKVFM